MTTSNALLELQNKLQSTHFTHSTLYTACAPLHLRFISETTSLQSVYWVIRLRKSLATYAIFEAYHLVQSDKRVVQMGAVLQEDEYLLHQYSTLAASLGNASRSFESTAALPGKQHTSYMHMSCFMYTV